jgi:hypothetical protein
MTTTTPDSDGGEQLVGRCYTSARRYPLQVGQFSNGGRIPGGPYTMTQLAVMIGLFVALVVTRPVWGGNGLLDVLVVLAVPYAAGWGICRVQIDHRNPLAAFASLAGLVFTPPAGRLHGRPWRQRPTRAISPLVTVHVQPAHQAAPHAAKAVLTPAIRHTVRPRATAAGGPAAPAPVVSGVQALLAQRAAARGTTK